MRLTLLFALPAALLTLQPAAADRSYQMRFEGRDFTIKRIDAEPWVPLSSDPAAKGPPPSPALRVGGSDSADQALRALEAFCGMAAGELKDFGAYGDPFWYDRKKGEWVVWFDCAPEGRKG